MPCLFPRPVPTPSTASIKAANVPYGTGVAQPMSCSYRYRYHDRKGEGKKGKRNQVIKKFPREQAECWVGKARGGRREGLD